jgi:hypothetical protein
MAPEIELYILHCISMIRRVEMRRVVLIFSLLLIMVAFYPQDVQAGYVGLSLRFHPCINAKGLYTLKVEVVSNVGGPVSVGGAQYAASYYLMGRKNGGEWKNHGQVYAGWVGTYWGNPEGTTYDFYLTEMGAPGFTGELLATNNASTSYSSITLEGTSYPYCEVCTGTPLFKMYLLVRSDSYCLIVSDEHPSVERQKELCFPGTDWVATSTPCVGYVCDEDCWECDYLGFERLSSKDLRLIYERHLAQTR